MGCIKQKSVLEHTDSDHLVKMQSIVRTFALHSYILLYPITLLGDSEDTDQTVWMRRLILAFTVHKCLKTFSHGASQI